MLFFGRLALGQNGKVFIPMADSVPNYRLLLKVMTLTEVRQTLKELTV